jgi:hypothetical protein
MVVYVRTIGTLASTMAIVNVPLWYHGTRVHVYVHTCTYVIIMLCRNFLIGKGCTENHVCFGGYTAAMTPVERGSECWATHTYTRATARTPLPRWRGLPRESPLQCLLACRLHTHVRTTLSQKRTYVRITRVRTIMVHMFHGTMVLIVPLVPCTMVRTYHWYVPTMVYVVLSAHVCPFPIRKL